MIAVLCLCTLPRLLLFFFFFNDTATTEIYTLSLHDALPISTRRLDAPTQRRAALKDDAAELARCAARQRRRPEIAREDRKSTRLNSSHLVISYAVFCLKKKSKNVRR